MFEFAIILVLIGGYSLANRNNEVGQQLGVDIEFNKITDCFPLDGTERQKCIDSFVKSYFGSTKKDAKGVLADLESTRTSDVQVEDSCHVISHAIGRYTFTQFSNVGDAFEACDLTCNSGCYHGVMERMFFDDQDLEDGTQHLSYDEMAEKIPGICDKSKFTNPTGFVLFQCYHGLGHALDYFSDYDLDQALKVCDLVESDYDRSACYGGAFMENITAFERAKRDIKLGDAHYPCNRMEEKYKYECYGMQTSLMIEWGLNSQQMADECRNATGFIARCFDSYGRDLSNYARSNQMPELVKACEVYATGYEYNCIATATAVLIDSAGNGKFAFELCDELTQDSNKNICYQATTNYLITSFYRSSEEIKDDCNQHSSDKFRCNLL